MAKKTFKTAEGKPVTNAAMSFITAPQRAGAELQTETKSKRYNLLLKPSLHEDIEKIAVMQRISVNEAVNRALAAYIETYSNLIDKYNETFTEGE